MIDIKPYIHLYESLPQSRVAPWVAKAYNAPPLEITFSDEAISKLPELKLCTRFYSSAETGEGELTNVIKQVLSLNIRDGAARTRRKKRNTDVDERRYFCVTFDGLDLKCEAVGTGGVHVVQIFKSTRKK